MRGWEGWMLLFVVLGCSGGTDAAETDTNAATTGDTGSVDIRLTAGGAPSDLVSFQTIFRREALASCRGGGGAETGSGGHYFDDGCYDPLRHESCEDLVAALPQLAILATGCDYSISAADECLSNIHGTEPAYLCESDGTGWEPPDVCDSAFICGGG